MHDQLTQRDDAQVQSNCVYRLVDRHVARGLGDKEALVEITHGSRRSLTYAQLQERTHSLANQLRSRFAGAPNIKVALLGSSTLELVVAWLATMRAGHLACPIHPKEAPEFYESLWEHLNPSLVWADRTAKVAKVEQIPSADADSGQPPAASEMAAAIVGVQGAWQALALMSSGSTGVPKICVHAHRAFAAFEDAVTRKAWNLQTSDRVLSSSGPYFSFGLQGIHAPLTLGATAILLPQWTEYTEFVDAIERERATVFLAVPTLYHLLSGKGMPRRDMGNLRLSLSAGERLPDAVRSRWEAWSGSRMLDSIGTTETFLPFFSERADEPPGLKPVDGFRYRFRRQPSNCSAPGKVLSVSVDSEHMMLGYLATGRRDGWFETGDLFARAPEGFTFVSRNCERIKVSGYWTSPQILEEILLEQSGVLMAAAAPSVTDEGLTCLRAFVVLTREAAKDPRQWRKVTDETLITTLRPKALRPCRIDIVNSFPTTPTGKLLRRKLLDLCGPDAKAQPALERAAHSAP